MTKTHSEVPTAETEHSVAPQTYPRDLGISWGLPRDITPRFGARLIQSRYRLDYLSDRASLIGDWSEVQIAKLDLAFPEIIKALEANLLTGELDAQRKHCITTQHSWLYLRIRYPWLPRLCLYRDLLRDKRGHHALSQGVIAGETPVTYRVTDLVTDDDLLTIAQAVARQKLAKGEAITDKHLAHQALQGLLQTRDREVFAALFLDNQHRILAYEELFLGTLSAATVYPRDVVKRALHHNAAALMLVYNHPSGYPEPSRADIEITHRLQTALELVDIRLLDHLVVATEGIVSLAERGYLC